MGQLTNQYVSSSYQGLLKMTDSTQGLTNTLQTIQTGDGDNSPLQMSFTEVNISGSFFINNVPITNGTNGTSGTSGVNGSSGSSGTSGSNGSSGTAGTSGSSGSNGSSGTSGIGVSGSSGTSGTSGQNGSSGSSGTSGVAGSSGTSGVSGSSGTSGVSGSSGTSGTSGSNGSDGSSGTSGIDGTSGTSGSNGSDGSSGTSGIDGSSGSSGTSGTSFESPYTGDIIVTGSIDITGQYLINGSPITGSGGGDRNGLITTGSASSIGVTGSTQTIQGGLVDNTNTTTYQPSLITNGLAVNGIQKILPTLDVSGSLQNPNLDLGDTTTGSQFPIITLNVDSSNGNYSTYAGVQATDKVNGATVGFAQSCFNTADGRIAGVFYGLGTSNNEPYGPGSNDPTIMMTYSGDTNLHITRNTILTGSLDILGGDLMIINTGTTLPFNYTSSIPGTTNVLFGWDSRQPKEQQTGSVLISGSNNILLNKPLDYNDGVDFTGFGTFISGSGNIFNGPYGGVIFKSGSAARPLSINNNGSGTVTVLLTSSSLVQPTIQNNYIVGSSTMQHQSGSFFLTNNILNAGFSSNQNNIRAAQRPTIGGNIVNILTTLNHISSSIQTSNNIFNSQQFQINNHFSSSLNNANNARIDVLRNIVNGFGNNIYVSGSGASNNVRQFSDNLIGGRSNIVSSSYVGTNSAGLVSNIIYGEGLNISGSNTTQGGSAFFGRYNATGSLQESTNETVFVVGTGTGVGNRRNALRIDNNGNSNFTGSVLISGSLQLNGVNVSDGNRNGLITTGSGVGTQTITTNLKVDNILEIGSGSVSSIKGQGNNLLYWNGSLNNFGLGNVPQIGNLYTGSINNTIITPSYTNFQTGSNNLVIAGGFNFFNSGSNNVLIGNTITSGSNNLIIGSTSLPDGVNTGFSLGGTNTPVMSLQPFQPLRIEHSTTISGSLIVTDNINNLKIWTGSLGSNSIGIGSNTLNSQTGSSLNNIAIGGAALQTNVTGANIVAIGGDALRDSVVGFNLAVGASALQANTTGQYNVGIGQSSGQSNTIGEKNTTIGWNSFVNNTTGSTNTAIGAQALQNNISGSGNVAIGNNAGYYSISSNEFFVGNDNYGSVNNERSGSLFYGQFNSTTANQTLQINANTDIRNNLVVSGSLSVGGNLQFNVGDFYSTQTQTLAAGVSGSVTYNNTGTTYGVSLVSSSQLTIANAGVYSITFSAQLKGDGGQDTVYIWLKKNGTNVADTATKIIAKNNEEDVMTVEYIVQAAASDYYEIAWQNTTGDGDLAYYAASGNIPAIPSIITSVKQIR